MFQWTVINAQFAHFWTQQNGKAKQFQLYADTAQISNAVGSVEPLDSCSCSMLRMPRIVGASSLLLFLLASFLPAQEKLTEHTLQLGDGGESPPARVGDFAWLEGHWQAEALGGDAEEIWSPPAAGTMVGMFRLIQDGKAAFYEIFTLTEEGSTVILRLKHFHPDLKGWEEKDETVDFPLVAFDDGQAFFDGLTYQRLGPNEIRVYLAMHTKEGSAREETFPYKRVSSD